MKTYVCDMCLGIANNPYRRTSMMEIGFGGILKEKKKVHLCESCFNRIVGVSRKKWSDNNG